MNRYIYQASRWLAVILSGVISVLLTARGYPGRACLNLLLLFLFLCVSVLFEKKRGVITVSYVFVFFIVYVVNSVVPAYYTVDQLRILDRTDVSAGLIEDTYLLYFGVSLACYLIFIAYLYCTKTRKVTADGLQMDFNGNFCFGLGIAASLAVYFALGRNIEFIIPVASLTLFLILTQKKARWIYLVAFAALLVVDTRLLLQRYVLLKYVLPVGFLVLLMLARKKISYIKITLLLLAAVAAVGIYGVVSEMIKLNVYYGGSYDIGAVLSSAQSMLDFLYNQIYRIFIIWRKLGGYAIYHAQAHGYFYGVTYVKSLASVLGFEYVSLPSLVASYHGSNYAQPGLLAEGYANFGFFGAIANICIVFFLMEFLFRLYAKKPTMTNLLLMTVPFSAILLDGGTINSAIAIILACVLMSVFNIFHVRVIDKRWKRESVAALSHPKEDASITSE